jgi:L-threonylcarbamoyladenylate synthase
VIGEFGEEVDLLLDAGPCDVGLESTIVSLLGKRATLLRPGGVLAEAIETVLGARLVRAGAGDPIAAPGMLASHYAPRLPIRLNATSVTPDEALLMLGDDAVPGSEKAVAVRNLSATANLVEAAARLFDDLATLDRSGASGIAVVPIPQDGLGEAINDRLARAAAPRPGDGG